MSSLRLARLPMVALALTACVLLARVLRDGPVALSVGRVGLGPLGAADVGVRIGLLEALLLLLVAGIGTVVATYSVRNLAGQRRLTRYAALETATVIGLALAVTASSLPLLAIGWTVATLALSGLVAHAGSPRARAAARQVRARLLVGDALLWAAVAVIGVGLGTLDRAGLGDRVATAPAAAVTVAALLVVGAGTVRSALLPAHRWLPETAEAPSPVSALLHAGLVNGVGVLTLLLWPLVDGALVARLVLFALGMTTAVVATAQMRTRADVKGRLAASTSSQMGYLAVQVALGIPAAVLAHVIGHGVWKASQFLGAGGAVARSLRRDRGATSAPRRVVVLGTGLAAAATVATAGLVPLPSWPALTAPAELLPLGMATGVAWLALSVLARRSEATVVARVLAGVVVLGVAAAYLVGLRALGHGLSALGGPEPWGSALGWVAAAAVLVLAVAMAIGARVDRVARAGRLPGFVRRAARASTQPWTLRERLSARPSVALPIPPVTEEDAGAARQAIGVAAQTGGVLFPLTAFVASNPLSGLEDLGIEEATRVAIEVWGAAPGPSATSLREALVSGRVRDADLEAALDEATAAPGSVFMAAGVTDARSLIRSLLLTDGPSPEDVTWAAGVLSRAGVEPERVLRAPAQALGAPGAHLDDRARNLAHLCCARSLAGPSWPGATGPWHELRAYASALDGMLRVRGAGDVVAALPADASATTAALLEHLGVAPLDRPAVIARVLARDPGWPAHLAWRARHHRLGLEAGLRPARGSGSPDHLLEELVATRLALDVIVAEAHAPRLLGRPLDGSDLADRSHDRLARTLAVVRSVGLIGAEPTADQVRELARGLAPLAAGGLELLRADVLERAVRRQLVTAIAARSLVHGTGHDRDPGAVADGPAAQLVTCIDVRSERLRRHLEAHGPWETYGAAGFFGLPVRHTGVSGTETERAPALLRPEVAVTERRGAVHPLAGSENALLAAMRTIEAVPGLPFGWAELAGWLQAPFVLLSTVVPRVGRALREVCRRAIGAPRHGDLDVVADVGVPALADAAADFLATLGVRDLAPLIVLVGHGGTITNNPHVAAYDCGACGGSAGDVSARVMAQALNDPRVRAELRSRGVVVPEDTWFAAALHDTTRDLVELLDREQLPARLGWCVRRLDADLARAGALARAERLALLPGARPGTTRRLRRQVEERAADWAQPRPEWGLAGAAAIVVGPRELTARFALDGRVFLQSYRADLDPDGVVLEQLLAAPVVVAQWITAQYWASTVDPERFGAGDKTTHNIIGDGSVLSAVVSGTRGDLRLGLPWQAVSATAPDPDPTGRRGPWRSTPQHEPVRLLALVCAETSTVERVLVRQPSVARLVAGGWITLGVVGPSDGRVRMRTRDGSWLESHGSLVEGTAGESRPGGR